MKLHNFYGYLMTLNIFLIINKYKIALTYIYILIFNVYVL